MRILHCFTLLALIGATGCATSPRHDWCEQHVKPIALEEGPGRSGANTHCKPLIGMCYDAVDDLLKQHSESDEIGRILVATLVDINDVDRTTMFGRQSAEFLAARLTQRDQDVIHATVREDRMIVKGDGQFLLSREVKNLAADFNAKSVLVGTYGVVQDVVYVSLKLVSTIDDSTLAATDFTVPRGKVVDQMLGPFLYSWR
jgi:TolB-like protein